ncbi:hypothetical protein SEA_MALIBO_69 [Gordonia phage Malibo]|nr:hypothetical protein SEA_MALIBO_69 [Gordonia phage Malibo]
MRVVNRATSLHRPLPPDAPFADVVAYWQKRMPAVDMVAIANEALARSFAMLCEYVGISTDAMDEMLAEFTEGDER